MSDNYDLYAAPLPLLHAEVNTGAFNSLTDNKVYDVIVIGVGSMGSATCHYLTQEGYSVLGLEQYNISHEMGSHAGQSRIIRQAYFEHPDYVPLLKRAYENWQDLENLTGAKIYHKTGLLYFGQPTSNLIKGTLASAGQYKLQVNRLNPSEVRSSYPQFNIPTSCENLFEPSAGFVTPERAILLYTDLAVQAGAEIHANEKVISWNNNGKVVKVQTDNATYKCSKLIITAGPWAGKLLPELQKSLTVTRQMIGWVETKNDAIFELGKFPCWTLADESMPGIFYGFPTLPIARFGQPAGLKLGYHHPGIDSDPDKLTRIPDDNDKDILVTMLNRYMPGVYKSMSEIKACM